jgi:hypothetical protein
MPAPLSQPLRDRIVRARPCFHATKDLTHPPNRKLLLLSMHYVAPAVATISTTATARRPTAFKAPIGTVPDGQVCVS